MDPKDRSQRFKVPLEERIHKSRPDPNGIIHSIYSIEFYNSMIIIRKSKSVEPVRLRK